MATPGNQTLLKSDSLYVKRILVESLHNPPLPPTMSNPAADTPISEKLSKNDVHVGHLVAIEDVDVAAALDSNTPLDPEVAAKLR